MSAELVDSIADWAETIWPQANWEAVKNATCSAANGNVACTHTSF